MPVTKNPSRSAMPWKLFPLRSGSRTAATNIQIAYPTSPAARTASSHRPQRLPQDPLDRAFLTGDLPALSQGIAQGQAADHHGHETLGRETEPGHDIDHRRGSGRSCVEGRGGHERRLGDRRGARSRGRRAEDSTWTLEWPSRGGYIRATPHNPESRRRPLIPRAPISVEALARSALLHALALALGSSIAGAQVPPAPQQITAACSPRPRNCGKTRPCSATRRMES